MNRLSLPLARGSVLILVKGLSIQAVLGVWWLGVQVHHAASCLAHVFITFSVCRVEQQETETASVDYNGADNISLLDPTDREVGRPYYSMCKMGRE